MKKIVTANGPIKSNLKKICLFCGTAITEENDSGWEYFTKDGHTTQSTCKKCNENLPKAGTKIIDPNLD
jgi:hypothetical protein